jgi:hypothetical protein
MRFPFSKSSGLGARPPDARAQITIEIDDIHGPELVEGIQVTALIVESSSYLGEELRSK